MIDDPPEKTLQLRLQLLPVIATAAQGPRGSFPILLIENGE